MPVRRIIGLLAIVSILLAACSTPRAEAPVAPPTAPAAPVRPTARSEAQPPPLYAALPQGRTPEGYPYLGDPNAPVTLVMYSDFL